MLTYPDFGIVEAFRSIKSESGIQTERRYPFLVQVKAKQRVKHTCIPARCSRLAMAAAESPETGFEEI